MSKYFKNITSFENLKEQYKKLLKANHPDNGGDEETTKEINVEFDALFTIWKNKKEVAEHTTVSETARETRRHFYTEFGWAGSRYDINLTLKEIAKIVRTYVKEKYPTCKFSVRTHYASMCQSLSVDLLEFPEKMYKTGDDLRLEGLNETITTTGREGKEFSFKQYTKEVEEMFRKLRTNHLFESDCWRDEELIQAYENALEKSSFYGIKTEYFASVIDDVNAFIASYNYDDSDSMTDYFDVNFYDGRVDFGNCKYVPKTARIKDRQTAPAKTANNKQATAPAIETALKLTYTIKEGEDTRDGSKLWIVRIVEDLTKEQYIAENKAMKERGAYYSKFLHGFLFRFDPSEILA